MTKTYNDALEWAAKWIEDTLRAGPETNERTIEFGNNMAMTLRAARLSGADLPRATAGVSNERARTMAREIIGNVNNYAEEHTGELSISAFGPLAERIAAALVSTPHPTGETTVESCLAELREMFPDQDYEVKFGNWESPVTIVTWREMTSKTFYGANLADCMAQVRAATGTEGEGEKHG